QARKIDVTLVTELTRWGRSMLDFFHTLQDLQAWGVSLVAQTGLQFDLRSAQSKLIASLMAALADNAERGFMQSHTAGAAAEPTFKRYITPHYTESNSEVTGRYCFSVGPTIPSTMCI